MKKIWMIALAILFFAAPAFGANGIAGLSVDPSTGLLYYDGALTGKVKIIEDGDGHVLSGADAYGALIVESGSDKIIVAPAITGSNIGMHFCVMATGASGSARVYVQPDAADKFMFYNLTSANGETVHNISNTHGDKMCFTAIDSSTWLVTPAALGTVVANKGLKFADKEFSFKTSAEGVGVLWGGVIWAYCSVAVDETVHSEAGDPGSIHVIPSYIIGDVSTVLRTSGIDYIVPDSGAADFTSLTYLSTYTPGIPFAGLAGITSLTYLNIETTDTEPPSGNLSSLATLINLTELIINTDGGSITGNLNVVGNMTALESLNLEYTACDTYTTTSLPATLLYIYLHDCTFDETEVDAFLCDVDSAGGTNGELYIAGSNAAPSSTGLACKTALEGKGWSVSVTSE